MNLFTSILIGFGLLSVRTQSVNPNITGLTAILNIANPLIYMSSGLLLMIIEDPSIGYLIYFLTGFGFSFVVSILLSMLFYGEARSGVARTIR